MSSNHCHHHFTTNSNLPITAPPPQIVISIITSHARCHVPRTKLSRELLQVEPVLIVAQSTMASLQITANYSPFQLQSITHHPQPPPTP
jgi:hypothetical protein